MVSSPYVIANVQSMAVLEEITQKLRAAEVMDPQNAIFRIAQSRYFGAHRR